MGGDHAPRELVTGAVAAARELGIEVVLVGPAARIRGEIQAAGGSSLPIRVLDAPEVIGMAEAPAMALRRKRQASILVAVEALRRGEADAVVSAGNTGAAMAAALLTLGRIEGIDRPAIAAVLPTLRGRAILVDVGANVDCRPKHLLQFAIMGSVYASRGLGICTLLREELSRGLFVRLGVLLATPRLRALARRMDYTEHGGAPLLGVNGICIITHGSSKAKAIRNSIALAAESVRARMVDTIQADIARLSHLRPLAAPDAAPPVRDAEQADGEAELPLSQGTPADA